MPDPEKQWNSRFLAQDFLDSLVQLDLDQTQNTGYSLVQGVNNQDLDALTFIWLENYMKDKDMKPKLLAHIAEHPDGYLKRGLEMIVRKWVQLKGYSVEDVLHDFCLVE